MMNWWWIGFCEMVDRQKAFTPYFQPVPLPDILTITNLRHAASRVWTCAESEFRLCWRKLCSSDNCYITAITAISRRHTQSIKVWRTLSVYQSKHQNAWINKANLKYIKINPDFSAAKFFLLRSYIFHSSCSTDCTVTQHKICGNMGFHWPVPDPIRENTGQWKPVFKHILCRVKVNTIQKSTFTLKKHCY